MPLPLFEHPVSVAFVDDSQSFLESVAFSWSDSAPFVLYDSPQVAAEELLSQSRPTARTQLRDLPPPNLLADLRRIHHRLYSAQRFSEVAIAFIDYSMPEQDGLALCSLLRETPIQLVLFTGQADQQVAITAFNNGLIDYFLPKQGNALEQLATLIPKFTHRYFERRTAFFAEAIRLDPGSALHDASLGLLVRDIKREHGFTEHYYVSQPEGVLFARADGSVARLVLESEARMRAHLEAAVSGGAPVTLIEALRSGTVVPYFWRSGGYYGIESLDWKSFVHRAALFHGTTVYHWALIDPPNGLERASVRRYDDYDKRPRQRY